MNLSASRLFTLAVLLFVFGLSAGATVPTQLPDPIFTLVPTVDQVSCHGPVTLSTRSVTDSSVVIYVDCIEQSRYYLVEFPNVKGISDYVGHYMYLREGGYIGASSNFSAYYIISYSNGVETTLWEAHGGG